MKNSLIVFIGILFCFQSAFAQSDRSIVTSQDKLMCNSISGRSVKDTVDPHKLADDGSVYRVGSNRWTEKKEEEFSKWFEENITADFFQNYNIKTDCADAALAARAIFARINHLPSMFYPKDDYIHTSKKWARYKTVKNWNEHNWKTALKEDKRFRKALDHWKVGVGTINLKIATHPVEVFNEDNSKLSKYMRPGCPVLSGGHTRVITQVDAFSYNPIKEASSTVPAKVRKLSEESFYGFRLRESNLENGNGVLAWNWPVNCGRGFILVPDKKMPSYSEQQHELSCSVGQMYENIEEPIPQYFGDLAQLIARDPDYANPTKETVADEINNVAKLLENRVEFVELTQKEIDENREELEDKKSALYDEFSTHSRDKRLAAKIKDITDFVDSNNYSLKMEDDELTKMLLEKEFVASDGTKTNLYHFYLAYKNKKISPEPSDSISKRFGGEFYDARKKEAIKLDQKIAETIKKGKIEVEKLKEKNAKDEEKYIEEMERNIIYQKVTYNPSYSEAMKKVWRKGTLDDEGEFIRLAPKKREEVLSKMSSRDQKRLAPLMSIIRSEQKYIENNEKIESIKKLYSNKKEISSDSLDDFDSGVRGYVYQYLKQVTRNNRMEGYKENDINRSVERKTRQAGYSSAELEYFTK